MRFDISITWLANSADFRSLLIMLYSNPHQDRDARFGSHVDYAGLLPAAPVGAAGNNMSKRHHTINTPVGAACYNRGTVSLDRFQTQSMWEMSDQSISVR